MEPLIVKSRVRALKRGAQLWFLICTVAIFGLAIAVRQHLLSINGGDEPDQIAWAAKFYFGGITKYYLDMRSAILSGHTEAMWAYLPGYPAFLALLDLAGFKDLRSIRIVQTVIDSAAVIPLAYVIKRLTASLPISLLGAGIYAIGPWWAEGSSYLLAESLLPALVICVLAGMIWMRDNPLRLAGWMTLGFLSALLPFFRSETILLVVPLTMWALTFGRLKSSIAVGAAFFLPLVAWAVRNHVMHDQFALMPNAGWYALWSGLGQVANEWGYFVSDAQAHKLLSTHSIKPHTAEAEIFWKGEYLRAWAEHPRQIFRTIVFRFDVILNSCNYGGPPALCNLVYHWFALATIPAVGILIWAKRWTDALLVVGPLAFALFSLGLIYVEPRYVRYAALTYVLGFSVLVSCFGRYIVLVREGHSLATPERDALTAPVAR